VKNTGYGVQTAKHLTGMLNLQRCRDLGDRYIEVSGGYTPEEVVFTLMEVAKLVDEQAGGITFVREKKGGE
jgi:hypothetical protein